jgi:hypothetical protein
VHGLIILRGTHHIIEYQSVLMVQLFGLMVGLPIREAIASPDQAFVPIFKMLDQVFCTGITMWAGVPGGDLWFMRLSDGSGVALRYDRLPYLPPPHTLQEPLWVVPSEWATTHPNVPD